MMRAGLSMLGLVGVLVGCHPAPAPEQPRPAVQPDIESPPQAKAPTEPTEVAVERETPPDPLPTPDPVPRGIAPPGVDASQTACEQSCAEVHDCALLDTSYTPTAAAAIELGCLGACVRAPVPTTSLFGCERPSAIESSTCSVFLDCLGPAWPEPAEPVTPHVNEQTDGCRRTCEALGRCFSPTEPQLLSGCIDACQKKLTTEQERSFGSCADQLDCEELYHCMKRIPGA